MSRRNRPLAASSVSGAPSTIVTGLAPSVAPGLIAASATSWSIDAMMTATDAPHRNASTSNRRRLGLPAVQPQIGEQHDRHRDAGQHESDGCADGVERRQRDDDQPCEGAQQDQHAERRSDLAHLFLYRRVRRTIGERLRRRTCVGHQSRVAVATLRNPVSLTSFCRTRRWLRFAELALRHVHRGARPHTAGSAGVHHGGHR